MKEGFIANCKTHDGTDTTMLIAYNQVGSTSNNILIPCGDL